jgi:Ca2+-binding RTX toxin-like protein
MRRLGVCIIALLACSTTPAFAATILPVDQGPSVTFRAGWNEQNHVRAWLSPAGHLIVRDSGATLTATDHLGTGVPCAQLSIHMVDCGSRTILGASLSNMDDWLSFDIFQPGYYVSAAGHGGDDWLRGGAGNDYLEAETAYGRGGNDWLNATSTLADGGAGNDRCYRGPATTVVRCER